MRNNKLTIVCTILAIIFVIFAISSGNLISFSNFSLSQPVSAIIVSSMCEDIASETEKSAEEIEESFEKEDLLIIEDIIKRNSSLSNVADVASSMAEGEKFIDVIKGKVSIKDYETLKEIYKKYKEK